MTTKARWLAPLIAGIVWLVLPAIALAGDCPPADGAVSCLTISTGVAALLAPSIGGMMLAAAILGALKKPSPPPQPPAKKPITTWSGAPYRPGPGQQPGPFAKPPPKAPPPPSFWDGVKKWWNGLFP